MCKRVSARGRGVSLRSRLALAHLHALHNGVRHGLGEHRLKLRVQARARDLREQIRVLPKVPLIVNLEPVEELNSGVPGRVEAVGDDAGVEAFRSVPLSLLKELSAKKYGRSGTITGDVILGGGRARDHASGGVLNLHLVEEDVAVFGELRGGEGEAWFGSGSAMR